MSIHATGLVEMKTWDEQPYDERAGMPKLTRASVTNAFQGDIEGEGRLEYLLAYRDDGSATFVGLERVSGRIGDRAGTFVLQHTGTFADKMNTTPKLVASRTLAKVPWGEWNNAVVIKDDVAGELARIKQQPGKNIVIYGSANLVQGLTELGAIDEYQLLVYPVLLGGGKRLFAEMAHPVNLTLVRTEAFKNGVVVLYYEPARS